MDSSGGMSRDRRPKRTTERVDRVVADAHSIQHGFRPPRQEGLRRRDTIVRDMVVAGFDVDRDQLADVLWGLDDRLDALVVQRLSAPVDLVTGHAWVRHRRAP
jgi:hypothetical protein